MYHIFLTNLLFFRVRIIRASVEKSINTVGKRFRKLKLVKIIFKQVIMEKILLIELLLQKIYVVEVIF